MVIVLNNSNCKLINDSNNDLENNNNEIRRGKQVLDQIIMAKHMNLMNKD
jgi:hypothetical protein